MIGAAIGIAALTYLYWLATEWIDLAPWNDVRASTAREKIIGTAVNAVPTAVLIAAIAVDRRTSLAIVAIVAYGAWFLAQLNQWWRPYLFGASEAEQLRYQQLFSNTVKILPPHRGHPAPDAQHLTLQTLTAATLAMATMVLFSTSEFR